MKATPIVAETDTLPRWAYRLLALLAAAIGLASSTITAKFFILGLERTESDSLAREALILAGILMIVVELAAFGMAALLPRERLKALRARLIVTGIALVAFEIATIYAVQVTLVRSSDAVHQGSSSRIANLEASIQQNRRAAAALVATGARSGQSAIASSRADGAQSLREAARIEQRNADMAAELSRLQAGQTPTLTSVLGEDGMIWYSVARSVLIVGMGLVMFAAAGALLRAGRSTAAAAQAGALRPAPAPVVPADLPPVARRWAAAGVPLAAIPAAAFAAPGMPTTAPAYPAASYSAPLAAAPTIAPNPVQSQAPIAPVSVQSQQGGAVDPAPAQRRTAPRKPRAASSSVEVGHKRDSGVGAEDGYRYRRIRDAVQAGTLKPSIRALQAKEGGGTDIVRAYLGELERDGVIERKGRGYRLTAAA